MTVVKVFGIGGAGNNTLNRMKRAGFSSTELIAVNTDAQALEGCFADKRIHIGESLTHGTGTGNDPYLGMRSAEESWTEIKESVEGADLVFVTAGQGGGTGTGATPVIAGMAKEMGALTIAAVTRPFSFEGKKKLEQADDGIRMLMESVDALIVVPNDRLLEMDDEVTVVKAFQMSDEILFQGISSISRLVLEPGLIKVEFSDVRYVLEDSGIARIGTGTANTGEGARKAAFEAIGSPMLESSINEATRILINISGGREVSIFDANEVVEVVAQAVDPKANMVFGVIPGDRDQGGFRVTFIASGYKGDNAGEWAKRKRESNLDSRGVYMGKELVDSPTFFKPH